MAPFFRLILTVGLEVESRCEVLVIVQSVSDLARLQVFGFECVESFLRRFPSGLESEHIAFQVHSIFVYAVEGPP